MAKFKAIFNFPVTVGNKMIIEQALERAYQENKDYLDSLPHEIVLTFHTYGMPEIALSSNPAYEELVALNKEKVQQILEKTGLFGYTAL